MATMDSLLLGAVLVVTLLVAVLVWQLRRDVQTSGDVETDQLSAALSETWRELEFEQKLGQLENHAADMKAVHTDITEMLRNPQQRGEFGEQQLDLLLGDHLPPDMYGIREQVVAGKTPDAYIESSSGIICIDSKFPLDNYEQFVEADTDDQRRRYKRQFRQDVDGQLEKIASDYVKPQEGTTEFAFAFIPSESVYYHLITEEYDLLNQYTKRGVQVVSPLTFGQKLELIKADVHAQRLSEQAMEIRTQLQQLGAAFEGFEDDWETLHRHVENAANKAGDVDRQFSALQEEFDRVDSLDLSQDPTT